MKKNYKYVAFILFIVFVGCGDNSINNNDKENEREQKMQWFKDAKFGIMVHWGPVTISGVDIGWGRHGYRDEVEEMPNYDPKKMIPAAEYDSLYKRFNPLEFDAEEWIKLVKDAGAGYFVFVTKHHDGFCLFDNNYTSYNITNSPYKKDIVKEIADACTNNGIKIGWYYSQRDWYDPYYFTENHGKYIDGMLDHIEHLMTAYGKTDLWWFDGYIFEDRVWSPDKVNDLITSINPNAIINNRLSRKYKDYTTPEGYVAEYQSEYWEAVLTIGEQWSWKPNQNIRSSNEIIKLLCKAVGNNGNLLLNITPDSLGRIEQNQVNALLETGQWLNKYDEAIYESKSGPFISDDSWLVSTVREENMYIIILNNGLKKFALPIKENENFESFELLTEQDVIVESDNNEILRIDLNNYNFENPIIIKLKYNVNLESKVFKRIKL